MSAYEQLLHPAVQDSERHRVNVGKMIFSLLGPFRLVSKIWSCWHRHMSRPFTRDGETYRVCLRCGVHRRFDLHAWETKGAYYREQKVMPPESRQSTTRSQRANLRLIA